MNEDHQSGAASGEPSPGRPDSDILMESGSIWLHGDVCGECRVQRGMPAISTDGEEVGWVAAVMLNPEGLSTALLMARPQATLEYYLVPLGLISRVEGGQVLLRMPAQTVQTLPHRNGASTS